MKLIFFIIQQSKNQLERINPQKFLKKNQYGKRLDFFRFGIWWINFNSSRNFHLYIVFQSFCKYLLCNFKNPSILISRVFLLKSRQELPGWREIFFKKFNTEKFLFQKKKYACFDSLQLIPVFKKISSGETRIIFQEKERIHQKREKIILETFKIRLEKYKFFFSDNFKIFFLNKTDNKKKFLQFLNLNQLKKINFFSETFIRSKGLTGILSSQRFLYGQKILLLFLKFGFGKLNSFIYQKNLSKKKKKKIRGKKSMFHNNLFFLLEICKIKFLRYGEKNSKNFLNKKFLKFDVLPSKKKIPLKLFQKNLNETCYFKFPKRNLSFLKRRRKNFSLENFLSKLEGIELKKNKKTDFSKGSFLNFSTKISLLKNKTFPNQDFQISKKNSSIKTLSKESLDFYHEKIGSLFISQFEKLFREEQLDIWVSSFLVFCCDSSSGFIEYVPNSKSLHILNQKKENYQGSEEVIILKKTTTENSEKRKIQNILESFAGYSLLCFILQLKDRHNGNILLNKENRVIHIDFGFIFDFFPGSLKFEADSFKLSSQFLFWLGGKESEIFENIREKFIRGFLSIRKNFGKFLALGRILIEEKKDEKKNMYRLRKLQKRFKLSKSDSFFIRYCNELFKESLENWKTLQYDKYQHLASGIKQA